MRRIEARPVLLSTMLATASCYHGLDAPQGADGGAEAGGTEGVDDDEAADDDESGGEAEAPTVGGYHLMRLTRSEYDNTVRDLLGDDSAPSAAFAEDEKVGPFDANVLAPPSEVMLQDYMDAAENLASAAVQDVAGLTGCADAELGTDACAQAFIASFARRGYRRMPTTDELDRLFAVYSSGLDLRGFDHGIELVVRAVLQSPSFLYRIERGEPVPDAPGVLVLTSDELASRLSYFILDSMPDDELFAAVDEGGLATPAGIEAQARRLLATDKAEPMVSAFHTQWMGLGPTLSKDPTLFPEFDEALMQSVRREVEMFATDVVLHGDGQLDTLLTSPHTFVDAPLAALYGVEHDAADPAEFVRVDLDPAQRAGLLTQIGVLAAKSHPDRTSPVLRGRFVRAFVMCQIPPPPPPDVDNTPPAVDPNRSEREQLEELTGGKPCIDCHQLMNPLGFGLDNFDAIGRYRSEIGGFPVDASGTMMASDVDGEFEGAVALAQRLADSEMVADCVARQWFRFALGRPEDPTLDDDSLDLLAEASATGDIREMIVALTLTDAFRYRPVPMDEMLEGEQR